MTLEQITELRLYHDYLREMNQINMDDLRYYTNREQYYLNHRPINEAIFKTKNKMKTISDMTIEEILKHPEFKFLSTSFDPKYWEITFESAKRSGKMDRWLTFDNKEILTKTYKFFKMKTITIDGTDYELHAIPKKQVILITTDGHDIYRGGTYWAIEKGTWKIFRITDGYNWQNTPVEEAYTFASGQAADRFVEKNKPKPKEWEILRFKGILPYNSGLFSLKSDKKYYWPSWALTDNNAVTLAEGLKAVEKGSWRIEQVKSLSDGVIFTVGDNVHCKFFGTSNNILGFEIVESTMYAKHINGRSAICTLTPKKQPVLTTSDGKEIYEGDEFWRVFNDFSYGKYKGGDTMAVSHPSTYFSSEQAAKDYIVENKPGTLSLQDVIYELKNDFIPIPWPANTGVVRNLRKKIREKLRF